MFSRARTPDISLGDTPGDTGLTKQWLKPFKAPPETGRTSGAKRASEAAKPSSEQYSFFDGILCGSYLMCIQWIAVSGGGVRPCHKCWQCRRDRVDDWVGRCIAEWMTAQACLVGTLTYGRDPRYGDCDHVNAHVLFYSDVQKYLKRIRRVTGGRIRFFCAGEYGAQKKRAHWHIVLFFERDLPPNIRLRERYVHEGECGEKLWPHGWTYWDEPAVEGIRYVCKYVLKDMKERWQGMYRFSSQPELGREYFRHQAELAVSNQLPARLVYSFPVDRLKDGKPRLYRMSRAAAFKYLRDYANYWRSRYGDDNWPQAEIMDTFVDELCRREVMGSGQAAIDFDESFALHASERRHQWMRALDGDDRAVRLYPAKNRPRNRYLEASRGT